MIVKTKLKDGFTAYELLKLTEEKTPEIFERKTIPSRTWKLNKLNDMVFKTKSSFSKTGSLPTYTQFVRFDLVYNKKIDWTKRLIENIKEMLNSTVAIHCTCPSYELSGASYNATRGDYAVIEESIAPSREYGKKLVICKHLVGVLKQVTENIALITKTYKDIFLEEMKKEEENLKKKEKVNE